MHSFPHSPHGPPQNRAAFPYFRPESDLNLANFRPCEDDHSCKVSEPPRKRRSVNPDCRVGEESFRSPGPPKTSVLGVPALSGPGEISSGRCSSSSSGVAGSNLSIERSCPMLEEHLAENTSQFSLEESGADADEVTSSFCGQLDSEADEGSSMARSTSDCSMVTSTHGVVMNRGSCRDRHPYFCKDDEFFQPFESSSIGWTDDKHSSYLSSMEDRFVKNMYDMVFCAVDVCGQAPEYTDSSEIDSSQSQLRSSHDGAASDVGVFRAWRNGRLRTVVLKGNFLGLGSSSAAVLSNPWIKRFRSTSKPATNVSQSQNATLPPFLGDHGTTKRMVGKKTSELVSDVQKGVHLWQERLQGQCFPVDKHSFRVNTKQFRRNYRTHAEGVRKRLKLEQQGECQGDDALTDLQGLSADAIKRLKVKYGRERQGACMFSLDRATKAEGLLPLAAPQVCEKLQE